MNKKTVLRSVIWLGIGLMLSTPMLPGRAAAQTPATEGAGGHGRAGMRDALQEAVQSLNLNDDQKAKVKDIFTDAKTKREAIFQDGSLSQDQKRDKMKSLREDTLSKVNGVLTPDQQTQLKEKIEAAKAARSPQQPQQ